MGFFDGRVDGGIDAVIPFLPLHHSRGWPDALFEENLHSVDKVAVGQRECFLLKLFVVRIDINRYIYSAATVLGNHIVQHPFVIQQELTVLTDLDFQ